MAETKNSMETRYMTVMQLLASLIFWIMKGCCIFVFFSAGSLT